MATKPYMPSAAQINELNDTIGALELITGTSGVDILYKLMDTQTLQSMGCDRSGTLNRAQTLAATRICRHWIIQAIERKQHAAKDNTTTTGGTA
jgi:hypothetical protein